MNPTLSGDTADIYFDINTLQSASSQPTRVNEVLVKVDKSTDVNAVAAAIKKELPGATVLTSKQLASQVNGSLSNAKKLASDFVVIGGIIVLGAALLVAILLTLSSIAKRVREIGTLRAIGWSRGRVVRQILAEMLGIGLVGAVLGVALGLGLVGLVNALRAHLHLHGDGRGGRGLVGQRTRPFDGCDRVAHPDGRPERVDLGAHGGLRRIDRHRGRLGRRPGRRMAGGAAFPDRRTAGPRMTTPEGPQGPAAAENASEQGGSMDDPTASAPVTLDAAPLYELQRVERTYLKGVNAVAALRGVDLTITSGEFICLEGPSGSGKSTLLQLLGALDTPTGGTVRMDGQELGSAGDDVLTGIRSKRIGFVFQQFNLIPTLSASENVALAMAPHHASKSEREQRAAELLDARGARAPPRAPAVEAVRRRATACGHRPGAGQPARGDRGRRAHRQSRLGERW